MAEAKRIERPLSPHLQIYKPMLTTAMSILHRLTGAALYGGTLLVAWWLIAAAFTGSRAFETAQGFFGSWFGKLVLIGYTWALIHHMLGGIRHLYWDTGRGLEHNQRELFAKATIGGSLALTIIIWLLAVFR